MERRPDGADVDEPRLDAPSGVVTEQGLRRGVIRDRPERVERAEREVRARRARAVHRGLPPQLHQHLRPQVPQGPRAAGAVAAPLPPVRARPPRAQLEPHLVQQVQGPVIRGVVVIAEQLHEPLVLLALLEEVDRLLRAVHPPQQRARRE